MPPRMEHDDARDWCRGEYDGPRHDWYPRWEAGKIRDGPRQSSRWRRAIDRVMDWWHGWWG
jgi:hypothetical protein